MVRFAGQTPAMDNREELLDALNDFSRKQPKEIPAVLEQFLKQVAKTGETLFPWTLLKALFVTKLEQVMNEFNEECINDELPICPNVENAGFEVYRARIMEAVHRFHGAPFTIQRLCELLTDPKRHYKRCDKFMRGLEKNVLVVSTVDPFGRKVVSESKNLVNGMDSNNSSSEDASVPTTGSTTTSTTPPVPAWPSPSSSSSPTSSWPVQADLITPSTAPLLEVCDLPDPKEPVGATTGIVSPSSAEPSPVNGYEGVSSSSLETASSSSAVTDTPPAELPVVSSVEETVDSSDQQVAAEEMVGVEEEAATSTAISQEAAGVVEETVVETSPVVAEVMREATDAAGSSGEVTPAASGDCLANLSDKTAKTEPSVQSQADPSADSQNSSSTESTDVSGLDSKDISTSASQDSSCKESEDGSEAQASPSKDELGVLVSGDSEPSPAADSCTNPSVQPETELAEDKASSGEGEGGDEGQGKVGKEEESAGGSLAEPEEESNTESGYTDASKEGKSQDMVQSASVTSDSAAMDTSPMTFIPSGAEEQVSPESLVPKSDSAEASMTSTSSSITSQNMSPSTCIADAEAADSSAVSADIAGSSETATAASSMIPSASSTEERPSEDADTSSTVSMETESPDSGDSVPKAAEAAEPQAVASSNDSSDVLQEAPSLDSSSQAEPMEQD